MRPRYLEVKNFLGHEHEQVALPEQGIFFLAGESGAGKSSFIVDAVGYALFGSKATRVTKQEQLRHKDHQTEAMEVRCLFEFDDGSRLTLARGINAKGLPWVEAYEPDINEPSQSLLLADTANRVGRLVRKRLGGMTWQQFYAAFIARQSEIAMLTSLKGAARKELVHRLLGMRELEKAVEEVASRLRSVRVQIKGLQGALGDRTRSSEDERLTLLEEEYKEKEEQAKKGQEDLDLLKQNLAKRLQELTPLEAQFIAYTEGKRLQGSISSKKIAYSELEKSAARHHEAEEQKLKIGVLENNLETVNEHYESLRQAYPRSQEYQKRSQEVATLKTSSEEKIKQLEELPSFPETAEEMRTKRELLKAEIIRLQTESEERQKELQQIEETGECFTCLRPLGEEHDHEVVLGNLHKKLAELTTQTKNVEEELRSLETNLPQVEEKEKKENELNKELTTLSAQIKQLEDRLEALAQEGEIFTDLEELQEKGTQAKQRLEVTRQELAQAKAAQDNFDIDAPQKLARLSQELETEEKELMEALAKAADISEEVVQEKREEVNNLKQKVAGGEGEVPQLIRQKDSAFQILENAKREREALNDKLDKLEEVDKQAVRLEDLQTYLQGFQRKLASDIRPALEEMGSEMLNQVSGGRHVSMRIDESYEIDVQTAEGTWLPASLLSGGESIRVNICLRLALTRLVSQRTGTPVRTLVFDEPLPSQDQGHVQRIMELLDSLRPFYPQQFIISHVGELRTADQVDYVLDFASQGPERISLYYA